jgi:hypothetical protein
VTGPGFDELGDAGHEALRAKVGLYFDGELAAADEPDVLDHLADCEICQAELGDVVGIHVGAATPRAASRPVLALVGDARATPSSPAHASAAAPTDAAPTVRPAAASAIAEAAAPMVGTPAAPVVGTAASPTGAKGASVVGTAASPTGVKGATVVGTAASPAAEKAAAPTVAAPTVGTAAASAIAEVASPTVGTAASPTVGTAASPTVGTAASPTGAKGASAAGARVTPIRSRRRGYAVVGAVLAAAAVVAYLVWPRPVAAPALALAPTRAVEARFEAGPFAAHRPYAVMRGAPAREPIALDALARLQRGDPAVLAAALASSGDVARAQELAAGSPSDRAAVALVAGQPEQALALLDGKATTPAAHWNRALAARALGLPMVARAELAAVVAAGEPGWRDEAAAQVAAIDLALAATTAFPAFVARADRMVAGTGPVITAADAAQFPARARIAFFDALRVADRDALAGLAPLAAALDRATRTTDARAALDRVAAARLDVRARLAPRYRAMVARALSPDEAARLVADLRAAGRDVDDVRLGALLWWPGLAAPGEVAQLARQTRDPWFELHAARLALADERQALGPAAVAGKLAQATDACPAAWAYRCAQLATDAAAALSEIGRDDDALRYARQARALFAAAATRDREAEALGYLGELERYRDRRALARATFEEAELRAGDACATASYARIGRAKLALVEGRLADARALLPAPDACDAPPDPIALTIAVDAARQSATAEDRARAQAWIAAARRAADPLLAALAELGEGRLAIAADPTATRALLAWLAAHPPVAADADLLAQRAWATDALIAAAGERADWPAAADAARAELAAPAIAGCLVVASVDQDRQVVAVRDARGAWHGVARRAPVGALDARAFVPRALSDALAGCPAIHVLARPPLHGNTQLLPAPLPWAFVGGPPRAPSPRAPRTVIVTDVAPPDAALRLPALAPGAAPADATVIRGAAATPARVLAELADATYVELDAHGVADAATSDAAFLALSPEPSGKFMLTAADVRAAKLAGAVVVLAACRGAQGAPYLHRRWTLPDAFVAAGARAVIATDVDVPDAAAGPVFAELRTRITGGEAPAAAVAALRARDPASWVARIAVFE